MNDVRMRGFARRVPVGEALALLEGRIGVLESEQVEVTQASGRVAAQDVHATIDVPHFDRSMMDGYALVAESTFGASEYRPTTLDVLGDQRAGRDPIDAPTRVLRSGEAIRVTTGAPIPEGADAVMMAEHCTLADDGKQVTLSAAVSPGKHVGRIGEDVRRDDRVVRAGRLLRPQDAGVLASVGVARLSVLRRPRVRVLITGDELLAPGSQPSGIRIVDSNSVVLDALIERDGGVLSAVERLADDAALLRAALVAAEEDVLLISGGSSVGPEDHAPRVLAELGELTVHGVAMRPSSPAGFGFLQRGDRQPCVFLLPGNPVSCLCAYEFFAGPSVRALGGLDRRWPHRRRKLKVGAKLVSQLGRTDYMRICIEDEAVMPLMTSGASILSSTTRADGVVLIDDGREGFAEGETVEVLLY